MWFPENDVLLTNHIVTDVTGPADFLLYRERVPDPGYINVKGPNAAPLYPLIREYNPSEKTNI
jgi:hypothetical protein